jgi:hypothetical protein
MNLHQIYIESTSNHIVGVIELDTPTIAREMPMEIKRWASFSPTDPSGSEGKLGYSNSTAQRLAHLVALSRLTQGH